MRPYLAYIRDQAMKAAILIPLVVSLWSCAGPGDRTVPEGEILDFGIFEIGSETGQSFGDTNDEGNGRLSGDKGSGEGYRLKERTNEIPLAPNTLFGFSWCSSGHPDGLTPVEIIVESPLVTDHGPGMQHFRRSWILGEVVDGEICRTETHLVPDTLEMSPGTWAIRVVSDGDTVVSQEFLLFGSPGS